MDFFPTNRWLSDRDLWEARRTSVPDAVASFLDGLTSCARRIHKGILNPLPAESRGFLPIHRSAEFEGKG